MIKKNCALQLNELFWNRHIFCGFHVYTILDILMQSILEFYSF